ncbi:hypothetical protein CERZMDRAFT_101758 [Cercospora zeae-maydis SCOH1-5]|uniref:Uncharacterized protein n=1 Tax=Cercospora zeae-maydis SCOH1-5 TaxID=717836 RepID=A0A6A6F655_9PEZI|nr:hypothetical protein CERZMDRAFT_101758 [Cercospora zeae-maydis SCOH1-5]
MDILQKKMSEGTRTIRASYADGVVVHGENWLQGNQSASEEFRRLTDALRDLQARITSMFHTITPHEIAEHSAKVDAIVFGMQKVLIDERQRIEAQH